MAAADAGAMLGVLRACLDPRTRVEAEAALVGLGGRAGYCACLLVSEGGWAGWERARGATGGRPRPPFFQTVATAPDADPAARHLASVALKNAISRGWRARGAGAVPAGDRAALRGGLVDALLTCSDAAVGAQLAAAIARAARVDWPAEWPGLVPALAGAAAGARGGDAAPRAARGLHAALKELASKRLSADARAFQALAIDLLPSLWRAFGAAGEVAVAAVASASTDAARPALASWLLLLKPVRVLLLSGFPADAKTKAPAREVSGAAPGLANALAALIAARPSSSPDLLPSIDAASVKLAKTVRRLAEAHPWAMLVSGAAPAAADAAAAALAAAPPDALATQACLLLKACLDAARDAAPDAAQGGGGSADAAAARAAAAPAAAALAERVVGPAADALVDAIIDRRLRLTQDDVAEWDADAEAFSHGADAAAAAWRDAPRGAAEALLASLVVFSRDRQGPRLAARLAAASAALAEAPQAGDASAAVLDAEAAAAAASVTAYDLHDYVDFPAWLARDLLPWLGSPQRALARRAALAVACWVPRASRAERATIYPALAPALASRDAAVALAAAAALTALVDDWGFEEPDFAPHAPSIIRALAGALGATRDLDSAARLVAGVDAVVRALPPDAAAPHAPALLATLPPLWDAAAGAPLVRSAAISTLARLVNALGPDSAAAHAVVVPILGATLDPAAPDAAVLLEDGLALWVVALRNAAGPQVGGAPSLLAAARAAGAALALSTEHVPVVAAGIASAAMLGGDGWAAGDGASLGAPLTAAAAAVGDRASLALLASADAVLAAAPVHGPVMLDGLLAVAARAALGGGDVPTRSAAAAASLFARLALASPAAFVSVAGRAGGDGGAVGLVDAMLAAFDSAPSGGRRLVAHALASLLPLPIPGLLDRLPAIAGALTGAWAEAEGPGADPDPPPPRFAFDSPPLAPDADGALADSADAAPEADRRAALRRAGVASAPLGPAVARAAAAAAAAHGGAFRAAAAALDPALAAAMDAACRAGGGG